MNWQTVVGALFIIGGFGNVFIDFSNALIALLIGAALMFWGLKKKGIIKKPILKSDTKGGTLKEENFHAVGVSYYEDNIRELACDNPDWTLSASEIIKSGKVGKRIFRNYFINKPINLQLEPHNPHDKNAIAVIIAGKLVGYISKEENTHVKDILRNREIKSLSGFIGGGQYKIVTQDHEVIKGEDGFTVNVRIKYV